MTRLTLAEIARQSGLSRHRAAKLVARFAWLARPQGTPATYDPRVLDAISKVRGEPHRPLEPAERDWLARYFKEIPCPHLQARPCSPAEADETPPYSSTRHSSRPSPT